MCYHIKCILGYLIKYFYSVTSLHCIGKPAARLHCSLPLHAFWLDYSDRHKTKEKNVYCLWETQCLSSLLIPRLNTSPWAPQHSRLREETLRLEPPFHLLIFVSSDAPIDKHIIYLLKGLGIICHCHCCLSGNWMCHRVASVLPCLMSQMGVSDIRVLDVSCS